MAESPENPTRESRPADGDVSPWALAGLGAQFFGAILLFVWIGGWLDRRLDSTPLFLLGGVLLGGGGSFYLSYRRLTAPKRSGSRDNDSPTS